MGPVFGVLPSHAQPCRLRRWQGLTVTSSQDAPTTSPIGATTGSSCSSSPKAQMATGDVCGRRCWLRAPHGRPTTSDIGLPPHVPFCGKGEGVVGPDPPRRVPSDPGAAGQNRRELRRAQLGARKTTTIEWLTTMVCPFRPASAPLTVALGPRSPDLSRSLLILILISISLPRSSELYRGSWEPRALNFRLWTRPTGANRQPRTVFDSLGDWAHKPSGNSASLHGQR